MAELRFRMKKGAGAHYLYDGTRILPGNIITIDPLWLGEAKDKFEQIDPDPPPMEPSVGLKLKHIGGGYWNVVNESTGKNINDKPLKKEDAHALVNEKVKEEEQKQQDQKEQEEQQEHPDLESHEEEG